MGLTRYAKMLAVSGLPSALAHGQNEPGLEPFEVKIILRLPVAMSLAVALVSCGTYNSTCTVQATVVPSEGRAYHSARPPGNQLQFSIHTATSGSCPLVVGHPGSWSTSDPDNTNISNQAPTEGLATCVHATSSPATIINNGTVLGRPIASATLTCN